jgi:hypothetical protein
MNRSRPILSFILLFLAGPAWAASRTYEITVDAGDHDRINQPICILLPLPVELGQAKSVTLVDAVGKPVPAQLTAPGLLAKTPVTDDSVPRELHFILPGLKAKNTAVFKATISDGAPARFDGFSWHDTKDEFMELTYGPRPVLRYVYSKFDDSTKERREQTYKVYHQLYDPEGKIFVTKGPGGLYTHHRGLFYGFNKITYGGNKKADIWHCSGDAHQTHEKFLASEAGPVLGRHRLEIAWHGEKKEIFAIEQRELTVYHVPGGQLVEFASRLSSTNAGGKIKLDGDPQHAGFQFRAAQEVAEKTKNQTYYLRPDGIGKPGEEKQGGDYLWKGMCFLLGSQRFTACYLDRPTNPKPAAYSERNYGRFGSYFVAEVTPERPLDVNYRIWLQAGEMKTDEIVARSNQFILPPRVTAK